MPKVSSSEPQKTHNFSHFAKKTHHLAADIIEVYNDNFFKEMEKIMSLVPEYNYIAMDTEFPGDVYDGNT